MEPITNLTGKWLIELSRTSNPVGGSYGQTVTNSIGGPTCTIYDWRSQRYDKVPRIFNYRRHPRRLAG